MKDTLIQALQTALERLIAEGVCPAEHGVTIQLTRARDSEHGDFASNLALQLAKPARRKPRELAERLQAALPAMAGVRQVEVAGPGFLNFHLATETRFAVLERIDAQGVDFGRSNIGQGQQVQVEFVSANPTGPLHVGHGRGAAYGATVADLLAFCGFSVSREYYVNDAGRQMHILAASTWVRYMEQRGHTDLPFPANGYQGEYVRQMADDLAVRLEDRAVLPVAELRASLPPDEPDGGDKEVYIDALIHELRQRLGARNYAEFFDHALNTILDDIREDLAGFGVHYQCWFSERSLNQRDAVVATLDELQAKGAVYAKDGALWFRATAYGDDKDRVVRRENGEYTYFAADIAYHRDKYQRGFDRMINVWGADHHGYVTRVKAALTALDLDPERLDILLVQFAILYRGEERVQMSTRSGRFVTLRELRAEVGNDAARFFYVQRRCEQHLDFDLELAKRQSNDNPMYYIQYAHARIASVLHIAQERGLTVAGAQAPQISQLTLEPETLLLQHLDRFPEVVATAALAYEPHQVAQYLRDLAALFHSYYNAVPFMNAEDTQLAAARLRLIAAVRQVLANGLRLLGVSAPESM